MVSTTNQTMSKPRWHPLPIDSQVVAAIEDRQEQFRELYSEQVKLSSETEEHWYWNHVFTVLDHAKKIFEQPMDELTSEKFENYHK